MPDRLSNTKIAAQQVELAVGRIDSLSTLPCVGAKLFSRLLQGQLSPSSIIDIIESDPSLAAAAFCLVGRRGMIRPGGRFSLNQALVKLSINEVRDIALSVKIMPAFETGDNVAGHSIQLRKGLMLHSLAVACCAKEIAQISSPQIDPELAYFAGLLHDIGKLALQDAMPKSFVRIVEEAESAQQSSCLIEQEYLGCDHAIIGKHLAQRWRFPNQIALAIWLHHSEVVAISEQIPEAKIAAVIQLADSMSRQLNIGSAGSFDTPILPEPIAECLGIETDQLQEIRRSLPAELGRRSTVLGLDIPDNVMEYCRSAHAAAARFAREQAESSDENLRLQSASSHLDFAADFLLSVNQSAAVVDIAENFATRWQKFYQTGMVCSYLAPSNGIETLEAVVVENLGQCNIVTLDVPANTPAVPKEIANNFAILNARDHIDWLFEQLDTEFDRNRTKLLPLLSNGRAVGAIAFELNYPGDAKLFEQRFRTSASIAAIVLDMATGRQNQQNYAERFARLISKPAPAVLSPDVEAPEEKKPAEDSLNALAEMAAGAAHELNNPLAVISGRAQLLAEAQSDKETKEILKQIYENAREASGIIEDLMSFAEPRHPRAAPTDVKKMLDEAMQLTSRKTNIESLDVNIDVADDVESVFIDSAQIVSAIANVISNAVESYGDKSGPIEITADADESGELVELAIKDQGCGMNTETLKKATQPFFSAKPAGRKRGMGLAYAARFIQINKGLLDITSEPGGGTTVTIYLPVE
ncbi:MAG: HDOD domain-containing protein [Sedimentisphaerales bacterium]|nr:HDOD domain-containing protein [Sedimentisphaerales bacterium]